MGPGNDIIVITHDNCPDGMTAEWALWRKFGATADYKRANYGRPMPPLDSYSQVIIADFSYSRDEMVALAEKTNVVVLDHHKTAEENLRGLDFAIFDMNKSGARLAWEWAFPGEEPPLIVKYTEDRDLWRWALPHSREVSQWLRTFRMDCLSWDKAARALEESLLDVVEQGVVLLAFQDQQVNIMADRAVLRKVGDHIVPVANATCFFSEVGEQMCKNHPEAPYALYYFDRNAEERQWGMRSRGDFDCSAVARTFGGGGHPGAAGFVTNTETVVW